MPKLYPPDHPLGSACLKIKRANIHINALYRSLERTALEPKITFRKKGELNMPPSKLPGVAIEGVDIYELKVDPTIKESWGLIVGDILGNLRAALDHVAWALAQKRVAESNIPLAATAARRVMFPLYDTKRGYNAPYSAAQRALPHILRRAHPTIEKFQPYNRRNWPELKRLAILSELANEEKHRLVTPVLVQVGIKFGGEREGMVMNLDKPNKINVVLTDKVKAKLGDNVKPEASFDIVLSSRTYFPDDFSVSDIPLIHDFIRDEVIPAFAGFVE